MPPDMPTVTFVVLLARLDDAAALARLIDSLRSDVTPAACATVVPTRRGAGFFRGLAEVGAGGPAGDRAVRVFMVMNEPGLAELVADVEAVFVVGVTRGCSAAVDARWHVAAADGADAPLVLAETAMRIFASGGGGPAVFHPRAATLLAGVRRTHARGHPVASSASAGARGGQARGIAGAARPPSVPRARPMLPPLLEPAETAPMRTVDPFDLLLDASARRRPGGECRAVPPPAVAASPRRMPWPVGNRGTAVAADNRLANLMVARAPTIVVVGSRKGGVGKTSHAAGVAIVAGSVLDVVGHRAAILDANIANPDAWGHFDLPPEATTVRSLAAALAGGRPAPRPVNARTPALACFPETREGVEYGRTDVRRLAAHLRERYAFVVVDMSNRLPDPMAGPEAAAAAAAFWLDEADVLVLPTACSRQDFNAVLDFLDVGDLPPVVVPCIVPATRRNRRHPVTQQYLADIGERVETIVEIPDEADRVRLAGMDGVAVQDVSAPMRRAYRRLTEAIVGLPARRRR